VTLNTSTEQSGFLAVVPRSRVAPKGGSKEIYMRNPITGKISSLCLRLLLSP